MPAMTIAAYLVEFDAALQARLGRRRRILVEVEDHLQDAATARLKPGENRPEAEAAAIDAFGDPARVAADFGADPLETITTRLTVVGQGLDAWMAQHPWGGAAVAASVPATIYLLAATVGVLLNSMPAYAIPVSALSPFPLTFLVWGGLARSLRGRPEPGLSARATAARKEGLFQFQYQWWFGFAGVSLYRGLTGARDAWNRLDLLAFVGLTAAGGIVVWLAQAMVRRWKTSGVDGDQWRNLHPWSNAVPGYSVAFAFAWLVILASDVRSPLTVRLAIGVVVVLSAFLIWLYRGSVSSRRARIAFHYALAAEEQPQEWVALIRPVIAEEPRSDREGPPVDGAHDNEESPD